MVVEHSLILKKKSSRCGVLVVLGALEVLVGALAVVLISVVLLSVVLVSMGLDDVVVQSPVQETSVVQAGRSPWLSCMEGTIPSERAS